jgi:hypothetical protein
MSQRNIMREFTLKKPRLNNLISANGSGGSVTTKSEVMSTCLLLTDELCPQTANLPVVLVDWTFEQEMNIMT